MEPVNDFRMYSSSGRAMAVSSSDSAGIVVTLEHTVLGNCCVPGNAESNRKWHLLGSAVGVGGIAVLVVGVEEGSGVVRNWHPVCRVAEC